MPIIRHPGMVEGAVFIRFLDSALVLSCESKNEGFARNDRGELYFALPWA